MKDKKLITITLVMSIFLVGIIFAYTNYNGTGTVDVHSDAYVEKYFDREKVMEVNIEIDEDELEDMFANAQKEEFKMADVTINGDKYSNVAVRPKGNSSLSSVVKSNTGENRFSFKINFDEFVSGQTMEGLTQLNLNNCYSDPTYMREFIAYSIYEDMGLATPEFAYAKISINGEYHGLYLAVESILEPFIENNFEDITGDLYKSTGSQGGALKYNGDDSENYPQLEVKSNRKNADWTKLTTMLKSLETGEDIEKYLDIDSVLKNIALNTALQNMDSYQGNFAHNYYLYEENGKFTMIPWDLNMAFGGFTMSNMNNSEVLIRIDEPVSGNMEDRPLVSNLLANEEYKERYHKYLEEIVEKYLDSDYINNMTSKLYDLIAPYVKEDSSAFYTFEQFETNIESSIVDSSDMKGMEMNKQQLQQNNQSINNNQDNNQQQNPENPGGKGKSLPGILEISQAMSTTIKDQLSGKVSSIKADSEKTMTGMGGEGMPPQMPGGNNGEGMPPQMPGGDNGEGMPAQMPGGDNGEGMPPQMPGGNNGDGMSPQIPGGNNQDKMPQTPGGMNTTYYNTFKLILSLGSIATMGIVVIAVSKFKRRRYISSKNTVNEEKGIKYIEKEI